MRGDVTPEGGEPITLREQIDSGGVDLLGVHQMILNASAEANDRPSNHNVELAAGGRLMKHRTKLWPLVPCSRQSETVPGSFPEPCLDRVRRETKLLQIRYRSTDWPW